MSEQKDLVAARRNEPWREELRKSHTGKERMSIPRVKMTEVDPHERARSLTKEVNCGLTEEEARREAIRCLDCANPSCMEGCPVSINIPSFIKNVERETLPLQRTSFVRVARYPLCVVVYALRRSSARSTVSTQRR